MANFFECGDHYRITIPSWKDIDRKTFYVIRVEIGDVWWTVDRRYSEFSALHQILVVDHGVTVDILPPKKVIGNREEDFINKRRISLEVYLNTVVRFLQKAMPNKLAVFLNFNKCDVSFIVRNLAVKFYQCGELILSKMKKFSFTPLEIYAINERLKQPRSSSDSQDQTEDFSHVLDFCCQVTELKITGSEVPITDSNIVPNFLPMQFSVFRTLDNLILRRVNCDNMSDLGFLRKTLKHIHFDGGPLKNLIDLFLCDQIHKTDLNVKNQWELITDVTISNTAVKNIDHSINILPNLTRLTLDGNKISNLPNVHIPLLTELTIRNNHLNSLDVLDLNKLVVLDLSENQIVTLAPFSKLTSLETLNVQMNLVKDINEIGHICHLPSLENILLTGNPVSQIVDYRVKVLEFFENRAFQICLDNENANQKELDKVAILIALHSSKKELSSNPP